MIRISRPGNRSEPRFQNPKPNRRHLLFLVPVPPAEHKAIKARPRRKAPVQKDQFASNISGPNRLLLRQSRKPEPSRWIGYIPSSRCKTIFERHRPFRATPHVHASRRNEFHGFCGQHSWSKAQDPTQTQHGPKTMVEPDGIEPTTSCLQSTRSPN